VTGPHVEGRAWLFGGDLNTDVIHPPEYFSLNPTRVRAGLFKKYDPTIQPALRPGDVLVGGSNFGCGSSRETSIRSLLLNGIGAILAVDFARIFFRNATNSGLPCLTFAAPEERHKIVAGTLITVDLDAAAVRIPGSGPIGLTPPDAFIRDIWAAGGLLNTLQARGDEEGPRAGA